MLAVAALPVPGLILTLALPRATGPPADTRWRGQSPDEPNDLMEGGASTLSMRSFRKVAFASYGFAELCSVQTRE
jgi:hypothetical protein